MDHSPEIFFPLFFCCFFFLKPNQTFLIFYTTPDVPAGCEDFLGKGREAQPGLVKCAASFTSDFPILISSQCCLDNLAGAAAITTPQ